MNNLYHILAPYDIGSRYGDSSKSSTAWKKIVSQSIDDYLQREHGLLAGPLLNQKISNCLSAEKIPLILGGDHSLTFYAYQAIYNKYGPTDIVVFDAHHDSYKDHILNHYSVFYHLSRLFDCNIYWTGLRKDTDHIAIGKKIDDFSFIDPFKNIYLSIDLDYFSPNLIPSVMDPITDSGEHNLNKFQKTLKTINAKILGVDILEWHGSPEGTTEYYTVKKTYDLVIGHLNEQNK